MNELKFDKVERHISQRVTLSLVASYPDGDSKSRLQVWTDLDYLEAKMLMAELSGCSDSMPEVRLLLEAVENLVVDWYKEKVESAPPDPKRLFEEYMLADGWTSLADYSRQRVLSYVRLYPEREQLKDLLAAFRQLDGEMIGKAASEYGLDYVVENHKALAAHLMVMRVNARYRQRVESQQPVAQPGEQITVGGKTYLVHDSIVVGSRGTESHRYIAEAVNGPKPKRIFTIVHSPAEHLIYVVN